MDDSSLLVVESGGRISIMGIERPSRYSVCIFVSSKFPTDEILFCSHNFMMEVIE